MGRNDLRLNYSPFNNPRSTSYSELYSISHWVPCAPNNSSLYFNVLNSSLTLRLTLKEKWTFIDIYSYIPDTAPAFDIGYLYKMINSSLKKILFCTLPPKFFILRGSEKLRNLPTATCGGRCELGWLQVPQWFPLFWRRASNTQGVGEGTWPLSDKPSCSLGVPNSGEGANFTLMLNLGMRKSSRFHYVDKDSLEEIMLTQREMQRKESMLGLVVPARSLVPAVSDAQGISALPRWGCNKSPLSLKLVWFSMFYNWVFIFLVSRF